MPVSDEHKQFLDSMEIDEYEWLDKLLNKGVNAPVAESPSHSFYMPGKLLSEEVSFGQGLLGPESVDEDLHPYMIVGTSPSSEDFSNTDHLTDSAGKVLKESLVNAGFSLSEVYYTTLVRHRIPFSASSFKVCWTHSGFNYVMEEFNRIKPRAVLFLGREPLVSAFGNKMNINLVRGQKEDFHGVPATATNSHMMFSSNLSGVKSFIKDLIYFRSLSNPESEDNLDGLGYPDRDYRSLYTMDSIRDEIQALLRSDVDKLSFDIESGNDTGIPEDSYIMTFQWSTGPRHSRVIPLYYEEPEKLVPQKYTRGKNKGEVKLDKDGNPILVPEFGGSGVSSKSRDSKVQHYEEAVEEIKKLFLCSRFLWIGHNIRGDLTWVRNSFGVPIRDIIMGGRIFDTMLAHHLLESDSYGLKGLALRFTDMGAYDVPMHRWVKDNSGAGKLFPGSKESLFFHEFRDIAYKYLLPYALCDADATYRLYEALKPRIDADEAISKLYYKEELPCQHALIDIETNGLPADPERIDELIDIYNDRLQSIVAEVEELTGWKGINLGSPDNKVALLFRGPFKKYEKVRSAAPEGTKFLELEPYINTGDYPDKWDEVKASGREEYESPATSQDALKTIELSYDLNEYQKAVLSKIMAHTSIHTIVKLFLKDVEVTPLSSPYFLYGKGLKSCVNSKGRICTSINTLSDTGRWKHSKPNLAQLPKNKEAALHKLFDDPESIPKIRTIFKAEPGHVIMESDWKSAELYVMGYRSRDEEFLSVLLSGHDPHSFNAIKVFDLNCKPEEVKEKHPDKRAAVKTVVFGIAYGLSPAGLAESLTNEFGRRVGIEEAKEILNKVFAKYGDLKGFLDEQERSVVANGYVETLYGRRRYFPGISRMSESKIAEAKRQGKNASIQGTVADMLNIAATNLDRFRYETAIGDCISWEVGNGIHDALLVHVLDTYVEEMAGILRISMSDFVPLPVEGNPTLQVDIELGERWGEYVGLEKYLETKNSERGNK